MKVQTVLGDVHPDILGKTLTHEHLSLDFTHFYREPPGQLTDKFKDGIALNEVGYVRQYPYSSLYNLKLNDEHCQKAVLNDVIAYKKYGGGAIVENTTKGLGRDLELMKSVSETSKVHLIAGTGHYIADLQDDNTKKSKKEDIYNFMLTELVEGCIENPTIKAGFMGEIASVWPLKEFEKHAIAAAGEVQEQTGFGVSFHPHRISEAPFEIIRIYLEAGGRADKAVMSHLDRTLTNKGKLLAFADLGTYCQFDLFGVEVSYYQLNSETDMPSDAQRLDLINSLIEEGHYHQILMSHDIHTKHRLIDFGDHGYSHIINNILPRMRLRGISEDMIDQITIRNPAKWLSVAK